MISFSEAQAFIAENIPQPKVESVPLLAALGRVTAEDIRSPLALPVFDNSAMDGYVLRSKDTEGATAQAPVSLRIGGEIKAGDDASGLLGKKETYRIMTGAGVLAGGDTVLAKEYAVVRGEHLWVDAPVPKGKNIRYRGEEIKKNQPVLPKGSVVNPGTVGFLATMGMKKVAVYKKPRISLIATGSELLSPGSPLRPGKIYDSNTSMVQAALEAMNIRPIFVRHLNDKPVTMRKVLDFAMGASDIVVLMGGVSTGEHDHVKDVLAGAGVRTVFWKVSQKPGKPLYFGTKKNRLIFGLPGNPAAVFTCFYEYIYPAIRLFMSHPSPYLASEIYRLKESLRPDPEKTLFIKSRMEYGQDKTVLPLKHQKSHMISSLCSTDSLMVVPHSEKMVEKGQSVLVHALPYASGNHYES